MLQLLIFVTLIYVINNETIIVLLKTENIKSEKMTIIKTISNNLFNNLDYCSNRRNELLEKIYFIEVELKTKFKAFKCFFFLLNIVLPKLCLFVQISGQTNKL
jgi:hypothetical protein